jgi:dipeptidyl aminopeptidase/acylaminoacyl peptidase
LGPTGTARGHAAGPDIQRAELGSEQRNSKVFGEENAMRKTVTSGLLLLLIQFLVSASALAVAAAQEPDGKILNSKPWPPLPIFESLDDFGRNYFPRAVYEEARTQKEFDLLEITYASDGLPVRGMLIKPKAPGTRKWPAIIFNRGGNGDLGRITDNGQPCGGMANTSCLDVADLYLFAKAGFVVIASDYRYQGATVKRDEWGGVEVDDVLNLVPALKSLDFVDPERLYMFGLSRGGTMTYLAIKRGVPVKAAAVIGGVSDVKAWVDARPEMGLVNGNEFIDGFAKIWPDYQRRAEEHYRARSAIYWADQINVPVLILHSRTDRLVPVTQALRIAEALQEKGKVYALHIYERDGHALPENRDDRDRMIIDWFNRASQGGQ